MTPQTTASMAARESAPPVAAAGGQEEPPPSPPPRQHVEKEDKDEDDGDGTALGDFFADERHQAPPFLLRPFNEDRDRPPTVVPLKQDSRDALGGRVWRASVFLLRWLERRSPSLAGQALLDVGAGIGVLGLACALAEPAPRLVVVTDQDCMLSLLEHNSDKVEAVVSLVHDLLSGRGFPPLVSPSAPAPNLSAPCRLAACRLDWLERGQGEDAAALRRALGEAGGASSWDWILVADCVYYEHLFAPLVDTLASLAGPKTRVVVCNDDARTSAREVEAATGARWDAGFFALLQEKFEVEEDRMYGDGGGRGFQEFGIEDGGPYRVVVCRRRRGAAVAASK